MKVINRVICIIITTKVSKETTTKYTIGLTIIIKQVNAINIQINIGINMSTTELTK